MAWSSTGQVMIPRGDRAALARAVRRYDTAPIVDRLQIRGRALLADLVAIEPHLPRRGTVVDLGCGRGLFANLLLEASSEREVLGVDPDPRKIAVARATARPGLEFRIGDATSVELPTCDAVAIVDVLYLLTLEEQVTAIERAAAAIQPGGRIVVYAQERRADPRFWLGYAQERLATAIGATRGGTRGLHYASRAEMLSRLEGRGLTVEVIDLAGRPYTDAIYVGVKPAW